MGSSVEFQPYLDSIIRHYGKWQRLYTLTDAEGRKAEEAEETPFFDFGLMVQPVVKAEPNESSEAGEEPKEKIERLEVLAGLRQRIAANQKKPHVLLIGRPGSGKSTALARLMLELAQEGQIPVLVELRSWQSSVLELIRVFFKRHELRLTVEQVEALLDEQRLVLLVDGVNELPSEAARRDMNLFRKAHSRVPIVFTTRDLGLGGDLGIEKKLEMQPLTDKQMRAFVEAYLPEKADGMLRQLKGRLRELGQTPLLLWMLCSLFQQKDEIPRNLGEVFRAFTRGYEQRIKQDVVMESDRRLWPDLLQALAAAMMQGETRVDFQVAIAPSEINRIFADCLCTDAPLAPHQALDDLLKYHLIQRNGDLVEFQHQLIQEYYAGEWLLERIGDIDEQALSRDYLNYQKWTEPIAFTLSLSNSQDACEKILEKAKIVDFLMGSRLSGEVNISLREFSFNYLFKDTSLSPLILLGLQENSSTTAIPLLKELLSQSNQELRQIAVKILGHIQAVESLNILRETILDSEEVVRGESAQALENFSSPEVVSLLQKYKNYKNSLYVQIRIETALWHLCGDEEMPMLMRPIEYIPLTQEEQYVVRLEDGSIDIAKVKEIIQRWPFWENELCTNSLSSVPEPQVTDLIISKLVNEFDSIGLRNWDVLSVINSRELTQSHLEELRDILITCCKSNFPPLRAEAVKVIGRSDYPDRTVLLKFFISDPDSRVRQAAIYALSDIGGETELKILGDELLKQPSDDCTHLIEGIVQSKSAIAEPYLLIKLRQLELNRTNNVWLIKKVIQAFEHVGTPALLPMLFHRRCICKDYDEAKILAKTIRSIQARHGFYNYEIFDSLPTQSKPSSEASMSNNNSTNQPIINFNASVGQVNTGNVEIKGDQVGIQTQYTTNPEIQPAITQLQDLLTTLQNQNPNITTETEALAIIDAEFTEIQTTPIHRLSNLRQQLLNPERHAQAFKAALIEFAQKQLENSPLAAAAITYFDKLSETPDQGA